jgi:hypothetical protein
MAYVDPSRYIPKDARQLMDGSKSMFNERNRVSHGEMDSGIQMEGDQFVRSRWKATAAPTAKRNPGLRRKTAQPAPASCPEKGG